MRWVYAAAVEGRHHNVRASYRSTEICALRQNEQRLASNWPHLSTQFPAQIKKNSRLSPDMLHCGKKTYGAATPVPFSEPATRLGRLYLARVSPEDGTRCARIMSPSRLPTNCMTASA